MDWLLYKGVNEGGAIYLKPYLEGFYIECNSSPALVCIILPSRLVVI